jgi:hypothetical protein
MQTKFASIEESLANAIVGYCVLCASQSLVFPWFGIEVSGSTNLKIGLCIHCVSVIRYYLIRRFFAGKEG